MFDHFRCPLRSVNFWVARYPGIRSPAALRLTQTRIRNRRPVDSGREAGHAGPTSAHRKPPRLRYLPTCSKCSRASAPLHEQQLTLTRIRQPALHGFGGNPHRVAPLRAGSHHSELHGRESTSRRAFSSAGVGTDSIHAPHVGRDWRSARRTCGQRSFNPRAPRGARRIGT